MMLRDAVCDTRLHYLCDLVYARCMLVDASVRCVKG
jgi:hypothetical protein